MAEVEEKVKKIEDAVEILASEVREIDEVSPKCASVLEAPLSKDRCYSFRGIRQWVMCRAWEIMETEKVPFSEAISRAWAEAKKGCTEISAVI